MIEWVKDTGSTHVEVTSPTATERKAQDTLEEHRMFMENDATVRYSILHNVAIVNAELMCIICTIYSCWCVCVKNLRSIYYCIQIMFQEENEYK